MEPTTSTNINTFLERYWKVHAYSIAPSVMKPGGDIERPMLDVQLKKRHLNVRDAWEIGMNDFDAAAIMPDDDPTVPDGVCNPPVAGLIAWKRKNAEVRDGPPRWNDT